MAATTGEEELMTVVCAVSRVIRAAITSCVFSGCNRLGMGKFEYKFKIRCLTTRTKRAHVYQRRIAIGSMLAGGGMIRREISLRCGVWRLRSFEDILVREERSAIFRVYQ